MKMLKRSGLCALGSIASYVLVGVGPGIFPMAVGLLLMFAWLAFGAAAVVFLVGALVQAIAKVF